MMSKGGSKQQKLDLPDWWEDMAKLQSARAGVAANAGPPIWMGPDVAAVSPLTQAFYGSVGNLGQSSGNIPAGGDPLGQYLRSLPPVQQGPGGAAGYSGYPMVQQNMQAVGEEHPGIWDALYELYPFLAPEGYQPTEGSRWAGSQPISVADMTVSDLLALLQEEAALQQEGAGDAGNSVGGGGNDAASVGDSTDAGMGFGGGSDGPF